MAFDVLLTRLLASGVASRLASGAAPPGCTLTESAVTAGVAMATRRAR
jgi:hypothetical protein